MDAKGSLNAIGNTPLRRLHKVEQLLELPFELYAKVELHNPSGSIKDRPAAEIILHALDRGDLHEGDEVVEATSGNMGISLAMIAAMLNLKCRIYMPRSASEERRTLMKGYGAELVLIDGGMKECSLEAQAYCKAHPNAFLADQFNNPDSVVAHYKTAQEIIDGLGQLPDYFIAGIGTGGTISGCATIFKKKGATKVVGIEPAESPLLNKGVAAPHKIQGIGANFVPSILKRDLIDEVLDVSEVDAYQWTRYLAKSTDLFVGITSGAALAGLMQMKDRIKPGSKVVMIFPDSGQRYLSVEGLYD